MRGPVDDPARVDIQVKIRGLETGDGKPLPECSLENTCCMHMVYGYTQEKTPGYPPHIAFYRETFTMT